MEESGEKGEKCLGLTFYKGFVQVNVLMAVVVNGLGVLNLLCRKIIYKKRIFNRNHFCPRAWL